MIRGLTQKKLIATRVSYFSRSKNCRVLYVNVGADSLPILLCETGHDEPVRVKACQGDELVGARRRSSGTMPWLGVCSRSRSRVD